MEEDGRRHLWSSGPGEEHDGWLGLSDDELPWVARSLLRCGATGRAAIRGAVTMARAGGGERERVRKLAAAAGLD